MISHAYLGRDGIFSLERIHPSDKKMLFKFETFKKATTSGVLYTRSNWCIPEKYRLPTERIGFVECMVFAQPLSVRFDLSKPTYSKVLNIDCVKVTQVGTTTGRRVCVKHDEDGYFCVALWDKAATGKESLMVVYLNVNYIPHLDKHGIHYERSKSDSSSIKCLGWI